MEENNKIAWWRYVLSVPVYAVLSVIGGAVLLIFNAFSPRYFRYFEGDLGYSIMQIATGPVGLLLANLAVVKLTQEKRTLLPVVLNIVAATLFIIVALFPVVMGSEFTRDTFTVLLAGATAATFAVIQIKDYNKAGKQGG